LPGRENAKFDANGNLIPAVKSKRGRGTNRVYAQVALPNENGQKLTGKQLLEIFDKVCKDGTTIATDDFSSYNILDRVKRFAHVTVNHSAGQFSAGNGVHTNNIENFWRLIKRQWVGTHHHYSVKHMQGYINEMCFRQNHHINAFDILLGQCIKKVV
jgi:transposase-like protein